MGELGITRARRHLAIIAEQGPSSFYEGALAGRIVSGVKKLGGLWTKQDLKTYRAVERKPIELDYRGHRVITMPPPSAGGIVLRQILGASELLGIHAKPYRSVEAFHLYVEAARRAFADRTIGCGAPDFAVVPAQSSLARYIASRMRDIDPASCHVVAARIAPVCSRASRESHDTTHYSVVDRDGNAVATTYTLNANFGAKVVVPGTGVLLNNEMVRLLGQAAPPTSMGSCRASATRSPRKRMLSSMTPTIVLKDGQPGRCSLAGGPTITNPSRRS